MPFVQLIRRAFRRHDAIYSPEYYERDVHESAEQAAPVMAASIVQMFSPARVIDVGCGTGALLRAFQKQGCAAMGLEYSSAGIEMCESSGLSVRKFNILRDNLSDTCDVATSFEVAEHLPKRGADRFVSLLSQIAPVVIISAACPGQGGTDHINEQPQEYWIEKFQKCRMQLDRQRSMALARTWKDNNTASFYHKNLMIFTLPD